MSAENPQLSFMPAEETTTPKLHPSAEFFGVGDPVVEKAELVEMQPRLPEAVLADVEPAPEVHALKALDYFAVANRAAGQTKVERGRRQAVAEDTRRIAVADAAYAFAQAVKEPVKRIVIDAPEKGGRKMPVVETLDPVRQAVFDGRFKKFSDLYAGTEPENIKRRDSVRSGKAVVVIP